MATIGHHRGVCQVGGVRFTGLFAWWLTRTVHLFKLPRLDRKLRVVADWTFELFFPPDLNYFDLRKTQKVARVHVEPGEVIFGQGDRGTAFYIVEEGVLEVTRYDAQGRAMWRDELHPGDHFGEGSLLYDLPRRVTVKARTPAKLLVLASRDFKAFVGSFEGLNRLLSRTALRRPREEVLREEVWSAELLVAPVATVMSRPRACIPDSATLGEAAVEAADQGGGLVLLVDAEGKLTGLVTTSDLCRALTHGRGLSEAVHTVAVREVVTLSPDQSVRDALGLLYIKDVKQAPVVDADSRPSGVLGYADVAAARARARGTSQPVSEKGGATA